MICERHFYFISDTRIHTQQCKCKIWKLNKNMFRRCIFSGFSAQWKVMWYEFVSRNEDKRCSASAFVTLDAWRAWIHNNAINDNIHDAQIATMNIIFEALMWQNQFVRQERFFCCSTRAFYLQSTKEELKVCSSFLFSVANSFWSKLCTWFRNRNRIQTSQRLRASR